jgi:hypothetical protein
MGSSRLCLCDQLLELVYICCNGRCLLVMEVMTSRYLYELDGIV